MIPAHIILGLALIFKVFISSLINLEKYILTPHHEISFDKGKWINETLIFMCLQAWKLERENYSKVISNYPIQNYIYSVEEENLAADLLPKVKFVNFPL